VKKNALLISWAWWTLSWSWPD